MESNKANAIKALSCALCIVAVFVVFSCGGETQRSVFTEGRFEYIEGDVQLNGSPADFDQIIEKESSIATGTASLCDLIFNQKNIVHIGENTIFNVDMADAPGTVNLSRGSLLFVAKKLLQIKDSANLTVITPTAVLGVRGTSFYVNAENENSTYLCICNGSLHAEDINGENELDLAAPHHRALRFIKKNGSITHEDATLLYHGDSDVEQAAEKIGVTIDWTKTD